MRQCRGAGFECRGVVVGGNGATLFQLFCELGRDGLKLGSRHLGLCTAGDQDIYDKHKQTDRHTAHSNTPRLFFFLSLQQARGWRNGRVGRMDDENAPLRA